MPNMLNELIIELHELTDNPLIKRGQYSYNRSVQSLLLRIFESDYQKGLTEWKKILSLMIFQRRSQDFTDYMLKEIILLFGIEKVLITFDRDAELKTILFSVAPEIPYYFFECLIQLNNLPILDKYLDLILHNISSYYNNCKCGTFELSSFLERILFFCDANKKVEAHLKKWEITAFEKHNKNLVDYQNDLTYDVNVAFPNQEDITPIIIPQETVKQTKYNYPTKTVLERIETINLIIQEYKKEKYPMMFKFDQSKSAFINLFLALHGKQYSILPNIMPDDTSLNYICSVPESHLEYFCLMCHQSFPASRNKGIFGYHIYNENIFDVFLMYESESMNFYKQYIRIHRSWESKSQRSSKDIRLAQIRANIEKYGFQNDIGVLFKMLDSKLLPSIAALQDRLTILASESKHSFDYEYISRLRQDIYNKMLADGQIEYKWISEKKMFDVIQNHFADAVFQARPSWLSPQSLDCYIPSQNLAFEYQGKQHYEAIEYFGGEDALKKQQLLDLKKIDLALLHKVKLIEWRYDEPITEFILLDKLKKL